MSKKTIILSTAAVFALAAIVYIWLMHTPSISDFMDGVPSHSANTELRNRNESMDYAVHYYDISLEHVSDEFWNLSRTKLAEGSDTRFVAGWEILHNSSDLVDLEARFEITLGHKRSVGTSYDEDFFNKHALLLVDLCKEGAVTLYFYPENLRIDGETISLDIRYDTDSAWVGSCAGQYVLITIPKTCTTAELNLIHDPGE